MKYFVILETDTGFVSIHSDHDLERCKIVADTEALRLAWAPYTIKVLEKTKGGNYRVAYRVQRKVQ